MTGVSQQYNEQIILLYQDQFFNIIQYNPIFTSFGVTGSPQFTTSHLTTIQSYNHLKKQDLQSGSKILWSPSPGSHMTVLQLLGNRGTFTITCSILWSRDHYFTMALLKAGSYFQVLAKPCLQRTIALLNGHSKNFTNIIVQPL